MAIQAVLAAAGVVGGIGAGIAQITSGNKLARKAQNEIDTYQRQEFTNLADTLSVRTEAQDFQGQQADKSLATQLDFLRQGGSFTNATAITNQSLQAKQEIAQTIQTQRNRLDELRVNEASKIRGLQEDREKSDLAGLGAQLRFGQQQKAQGIGAIGGAFGNLTKAAAGGAFGGAGAAGAGAAQTGAGLAQSQAAFGEYANWSPQPISY